jgi:hypothetical protein
MDATATVIRNPTSGGCYHTVKVIGASSWLAVFVDHGPPTWWRPESHRKRDGDGWIVKVGWLRVAVGVVWQRGAS